MHPNWYVSPDQLIVFLLMMGCVCNEDSGLEILTAWVCSSLAGTNTRIDSQRLLDRSKGSETYGHGLSAASHTYACH